MAECEKHNTYTSYTVLNFKKMYCSLLQNNIHIITFTYFTSIPKTRACLGFALSILLLLLYTSVKVNIL